MTPPADNHARHGFTLPLVLICLVALLILAIGLLAMMGIERKTARAFVDLQRADLAARAGLEEVKSILQHGAANDDYLIIQSTLNEPIRTGKNPAPYLFIARGEVVNDAIRFHYQPLFSHLEKPGTTKNIGIPELSGLTGSSSQRDDFSTAPNFDDVRLSWIHIKDGRGRIVSRYAYWVEDLQGKVDAKIAGNEKGAGGTFARSAWPFPAPGLNDQPPADDQADLDQIALFALEPNTTQARQGTLANTLISNRDLLLSPESLHAAAEISPPLTRLESEDPITHGKVGELVDTTARAIENGLASGNQPYLEQPLVPFSHGIDPAAALKPKLNLNRLLAIGGNAAVNEMASFIRNALPDFESRKGGFPDDYLETLAANGIDYADEDSDATVKNGSYRGLDAYPLVSEFALTVRWKDVLRENGRLYLQLQVGTFVELWNMSDQEIEGEAQVSFESKYKLTIGAMPGTELEEFAASVEAIPQLEKKDDYLWYPKKQISMQPNEYKLISNWVTLNIDVGPEDDVIASPLEMGAGELGNLGSESGSGYRLLWNGRLVDQSRGNIWKEGANLRFPTGSPRQFTRASVPALSHSLKELAKGPFQNNMGDPRMSFYLLTPQAANTYPDNYSPNRRNIRLGTIYSGNVNAIYGRVLPSEWPDGGHDSPFGTNTIHELLNMTGGAFNGNNQINPDHSGFFTKLPNMDRGRFEAPARISNRGRFYSATELGRIYDPIMWDVRGGNTIGAAGTPWGDVRIPSLPDQAFGGGNTLRIGRPEHPRFDRPGLRAHQLLDLFHAGRSRSEEPEEREGPLVEIKGHVNINTASREALRQLIAGSLTQDPEIRRFMNESHSAGIHKYPVCQKSLAAPDVTPIANRIADAVIRSRPYASASEMANACEQDGTRVFGNPRLFPGFPEQNFPIMQWTDSAAEETFARIFEASTVRSRNFRVWVIGQSLSPMASPSAQPEILSEMRKVYTVFADPGERHADGFPDPNSFRLRILYENRF